MQDQHSQSLHRIDGWRQRWLRRLLRPKMALLLALLVCVMLAPFIYRSARLVGLPDIGHPFDVAKYGTVAITDDQNAFVEYNLAAPSSYPRNTRDAIELGWSATSSEIRRWLDDNGAALELMRKGSKKPKAVLAQPKDQSYRTMVSVSDNRSLSWLAGLEASKLQHAGDLALAWEWHRIAFRHSRHVGMYGAYIDRIVGAALHASVCERITKWTADSRIDSALLRNALEKVISDFRLTQPTSTTLRSEYFFAMNWIAEGYYEELGETRDLLESCSWFLNNEPEVGQRIVKLTFANWLSQIDLPKQQRKPRYLGHLTLFEPLPGAVPSGGLSPDDIHHFFQKSLVAADWVGRSKDGRPITRERTRQSQLVVTLAAQLHFREHGRLPKTVDEFLNGYLRIWPTDPYMKVETPMGYRCSGQDAIVWSVGPDGVDNGGNVNVRLDDPAFDHGWTISAPQ